ncbi:DNA ligase I [Coprinopsis cinerea AmutBmut pab1-1]|nr:DNA ligase I [Coprinopsis cinerea AmutBmut pab1-1]
MASQINGIPFTFLCSLFRHISRIESRSIKAKKGSLSTKEHKVVETFKRWVEALNKQFGPLPQGTTAICFRLIFPHEDFKRKYDMQELRLQGLLTQCFGFNPSRFSEWKSPDASGCLGHELRSILEEMDSNDDNYITPLSIAQVDELLDELAALSGFTDISIKQKYPKGQRRTRIQVIRDLYRSMRPEDAGFLTQIILKDLRPLLYPLQETNFTVALRYFNTKAVTMLTKEDAMRVWDSSNTMVNASRVFSDLDRAAAIFEAPPEERPKLVPVIGTMIELPKSRKAYKCIHGYSQLKDSKKVWAEIKYDGERAQIHVEVQPEGPPRITIFSKSKRDSTLDRHEIHDVVRDALGFNGRRSTGKIKQNIVLDAEMVAFNGHKIDEFWRIRRLVENTAYGVRRRVSRRRQRKDDVPESQLSMLSDDDTETRHLGLVFFDVLLLDSKSLLFTPYHERRTILESLIQCTPGKAILAERFPIPMRPPLTAQSNLRSIFAGVIADHQEGLILKAEESRYNDWKLPWVKVKKDYIPNFGDTIDMVLVGASWEKNRARDLRVGPDTYTTFYIGTFKDRFSPKPHIEVFYTTCYGLSRAQLEDLNCMLRSVDTLPYPLPKDQSPEKYTFTVLPGLQPPTIVLQQPLLVALFGAGFTKAPGSRFYELRFPRIEKLYRPAERSWKDAVDLRTLHDIACESVGRDRADKDIDDWAKELFNVPAASGAKCPLKREQMARMWEERLRAMDMGLEDPGLKPVATKRSRRQEGEEVEAEEEVESASPVKKPRIEPAEPVAKVESVHVGASPHPPSSPLAIVTNQILGPPSTPATRLGPLPTPSTSSPTRRVSRREERGTLPLTSPQFGPTPPTSSPVPPPSSQNEVQPIIEQEPLLLDGAHVSFTNPRTTCRTCRLLRKQLPSDRKIHSIDSLLFACGWVSQPAGPYMDKGAIIVDCYACDDIEAKIRTHIQRLESSTTESSNRVPISIFTCDALSKPAYEFQ